MTNKCKKISFSIDEYFYNLYFLDYKGNVSSYIREHFIRGIESEASDIDTIKKRYIEKTQENIKLRNEIKELENRIAKFKRGEREYTPEEIDKIMYEKKTRAEIKSGKISDLVGNL